MKKNTLLLLLFLSQLSVFSQSTVWANQIITDAWADEEIYACFDFFVEQNGNNYSTNQYTGNITLGDKVNLSTSPDIPDSYIAKFDSSGNILWGKSYGNPNFYDGILTICGDNKGNLYSAGQQDAAYTASSQWLMKLDTAGNVLWEKHTPNSNALAMCVDKDGNSYVLSYYFVNTTIDGYPLNVVDGFTNNHYIAKFNPNGILQSVVPLSLQVTTDLFVEHSLTTDSQGNLIVATQHNGNSIKINSRNYFHSLTGQKSAVIIKLDPSGQLLWVKFPDTPSYSTATTVAVDKMDNIYIAGNYLNTLQFGTDSVHVDYIQFSLYSSYLLKLNKDGSPQFIRSLNAMPAYDLAGIPKTCDANIRKITIDESGYVFAIGDFRGKIDFNGTIHSALYNENMLTGFSVDIFIVKFDFLGNTEWNKFIGTLDADYATSIGCDLYGSIYINGEFREEANLDGHITNWAFVAKINSGKCIAHTNESAVTGLRKFCMGDSTLLSAPQTGFTTFTWLEGSTIVSDSAAVIITQPGNYTLDVNINNNSCSAQYSFSVDEVPYPDISITTDSSICYTGALVLKDTSSSYTNNTWLFKNNTIASAVRDIPVSEQGSYILKTTNASICSSSDTITIYIKPIRTLQASYNICKNTDLVLDAKNPGCTYSWSNGMQQQQIKIQSSDTYSVTITNGPCIITDSTKVSVYNPSDLLVTNLVTRNSDGMNEAMHIKTEYPYPLHVYIYNSWEEKIYESADYDNSWSGDDQNAGVYFYYVKDDLGCMDDRKGWVQLIK